MKTKGNVTELTASISEKVLTLMNENNLSARELALRIDAAPKTVLSLVNPGESAPSLNILKSVSEYFGVDIAWLIGESPVRHLGSLEPDNMSGFSAKASENMKRARDGTGNPDGFNPKLPYYNPLRFRPESVKKRIDDRFMNLAASLLKFDLEYVPEDPSLFTGKNRKRFLMAGEEPNLTEALRLEAAVANFLLEHWEFVSLMTAYFRSVSPDYADRPFGYELEYGSMEPYVQKELRKCIAELKHEALFTMPELCHFFDPKALDDLYEFSEEHLPSEPPVKGRRGPRSKFLDDTEED